MSGMISPRMYCPGDLIYVEEPFAHVLRRALKLYLCETCHKKALGLKSCTNCRAVKYCGRECQKIDWNDHKLECQHLKNLPEGPSEDFVRLLGKVILKVKDKKWQSIQKRVLKTDKSFDDLDSHCKEMKEDPRMILFCKEVKDLTRKFIGDKNMPGDDELYKLIGKVKYNTYIDSILNSWAGIYIFIGTTAFGHECIPNANVEVVRNAINIWACKKIKKGSDKITINIQKSHFRKLMIVGDVIYDNCRCTDCSLPYCDSILSRILDESRAYSVLQETERYLQLNAVLEKLEIESDVDNIDELLKKHEGVLGRTHRLHLRLLALKCTKYGGNPILILPVLKEFCESLRMVYGDHSLEMKSVYEGLMVAFFQLGLLHEGAMYFEKIRKLEKYSFPSEGFRFPFPLFPF